MTYRDLGMALQMSESGVKKIFNSSDCSFEKIVQISKVLSVNLSSLIEEIENESLKDLSFTPRQQEVFLKQPELFRFFVKLTIERLPMEEIKLESRLTEAQVFKMCKLLDELKIIKLLPEGKIKLPKVSLVSDFGTGPLLDKVYLEWSQNLAREVARPVNQKEGKFIIRCLRMRPKTYEEFLVQLRTLEQKLARKAVREMSLANSKLKTMRWISLTDQKSFVEGII